MTESAQWSACFSKSGNCKELIREWRDPLRFLLLRDHRGQQRIRHVRRGAAVRPVIPGRFIDVRSEGRKEFLGRQGKHLLSVVMDIRKKR